MVIRDSKDIAHCIKELRDAWPKLKAEFEAMFPLWTLILTSTHRPPEVQFELFKKGRKLNLETNQWEVSDMRKVVTMRDGIKRMSLHNYFPAKAFDVAVIAPNKKAIWPDPVQGMPKQWSCMTDLAKKFGLENGGSWVKLHDFPHFQLPVKAV